MGQVEFDSKGRSPYRPTLLVTYGSLADDDVRVEVTTTDGSLGCVLGLRTVEDLHASLGAYLQRRKEKPR